MNGKCSFLQAVEKELLFVTPTLWDPFLRKQKTDFLLKVREHFLWQAWHPNSALHLWLKLYKTFVFFFFLWINSSACEILLSSMFIKKKKIWLCGWLEVAQGWLNWVRPKVQLAQYLVSNSGVVQGGQEQGKYVMMMPLNILLWSKNSTLENFLLNGDVSIFNSSWWVYISWTSQVTSWTPF